MKLVDLTRDHIATVVHDLPADEWKQVFAFCGPLSAETFIEAVSRLPAPNWAFVDDHGTALVVGGFTRGVHPDCLQSWFLASSRAWRDYAHAVTAMTAERIQWALSEGGAKRVETVCLESRKAAHRWYEKLGMRFSHTSHHFDGGENAVTYYIGGR
jgi:hypothetical protein